MSIDVTFMKGGNLHRVCEVTFVNGQTALVEPYAIYTSPKKRRLYLWYQLSTPDSDDAPGWQEIEASTVAGAKLAEDTFATRRDYDPFDNQRFPVMHYCIPNWDSRQRWLDAGPKRDKQMLINRPL